VRRRDEMETNLAEATATARAIAGDAGDLGAALRAAAKLAEDPDFAVDVDLRKRRLAKLSPDALRARAKAIALAEPYWGDVGAVARVEVAREYIAAEAAE
jgi:hypothetical protein